MSIDEPIPPIMVIHTHDPERVRRFFEAMGLSFCPEQHGSGKKHHACVLNGKVLEIYQTEFDAQRIQFRTK